VTRRSKDQRDQDRADLLAVLEGATDPVRTDQLIAAANGKQVVQQGSLLWNRGYTDLRALARAGQVLWSDRGLGQRWAYWQLATPEAVDAEEDAREVERMLSRWEPAS